MAVKGDRKSEADTDRLPVRVVIKLARKAGITVRGAELQSTGDTLAELRQLAGKSEIKAYFSEHEQLRAAASDPFDRYVTFEAPDRDSAAELARKLRDVDIVEEAYVEAGPVPPPVNPADDPRSTNQGYLGAAPAGIDALWVWQWASGTGIGFVDLERGWTLNHEDLAAAGINLVSGLNQDFHGHGTAVLGEVVAVDNALGGVGIAPGATARVVSQWRNATTYSTAAAILSASQAMSAGDVLLLEAQTHIASLTNMPVEVEVAVFDAIRHAVDDGIIVVEAGGNGGNDLDNYRDASNRRVLNRTSTDFRDSGAIMVGAGSSAAPHARLGFSNHGSRIDCYAWGENIDTAGDGWQGMSTTAYTTGFGGTSGASPMVAGAALLLQSWRKRSINRVYSPELLRDRLSSAALNTASANPAADRIGVMPNLRAIIDFERENSRFALVNINYISWVYILFGLVDDSPGMIWVPGRGPVPVDPGWGRIVKEIPAAQRDLMAALAVNEISALIGDGSTRTKLASASAEAMRGAVDRIVRSRADQEG